MEEYLVKRSSSDWIELLNDAGVPCGPINSIDEVFNDPQVKHLEMTKPVLHPTLGEIDLLRNPIQMQESARDYTPAPAKGQHTAGVLTEYGYTDEEVQSFKRKGII